jgi:hypothetical protein
VYEASIEREYVRINMFRVVTIDDAIADRDVGRLMRGMKREIGMIVESTVDKIVAARTYDLRNHEVEKLAEYRAKLRRRNSILEQQIQYGRDAIKRSSGHEGMDPVTDFYAGVANVSGRAPVRAPVRRYTAPVRDLEYVRTDFPEYAGLDIDSDDVGFRRDYRSDARSSKHKMRR